MKKFVKKNQKTEEFGNVRNSTLCSFYIILCFHIYIFSYNNYKMDKNDVYGSITYIGFLTCSSK